MYFLGCLYTLHVCKHLFWVSQVLLYVQKRETQRERKWLVMFTWFNWNLKLNHSFVWIQNNNFKQEKTVASHTGPWWVGLDLSAAQLAPKQRHLLQEMKNHSGSPAETLFGLLWLQNWSLEPRFNRTNKWNLSVSSRPEHITAIKVQGNGKTRCSKLVYICMLPEIPVFFMNANKVIISYCYSLKEKSKQVTIPL